MFRLSAGTVVFCCALAVIGAYPYPGYYYPQQGNYLLVASSAERSIS